MNPKPTNVHPQVRAVLRQFGQKGGKANTEAQNEARRRNGQKGGRPKKVDPPPRKLPTMAELSLPSNASTTCPSCKLEFVLTRGDAERVSRGEVVTIPCQCGKRLVIDGRKYQRRL